MEILNQTDIAAFLQVRAMLPCPDTYKKSFFIACIGNAKPSFVIQAYLYTEDESRIFMFHKASVAEKGKNWQWICNNPKFQKIIHNIHFESLRLLESI